MTIKLRLSTVRFRYSLFHLLIFSAIFSSALATTPGSTTPFDPWRVPKLCAISASAMASFGTGMASLQLDMAARTDDRPSSLVLYMVLRLTCSSTLGLLAIFYQLWFITAPGKARRFIDGICASGAVFWLFVRLAGPSSGNSSGDDYHNVGEKFIWLDKLNLCLLAAVMVGILNAERRVVGSVVGDENVGSDESSEDDGSNQGQHEQDSNSGGNQPQRVLDSHELRTSTPRTSNPDGRLNGTFDEV